MSTQQLLTVALDVVVIASLVHFTTCFVAGLASRVHPVQTVHAYQEVEPELTGQFTPFACPLLEIPEIDINVDELNRELDELLTVELETKLEEVFSDTEAEVVELEEAIADTEVALAELKETALKTKSAPELRKECQANGIKWRNAHGKGKHLKKGEMIAALMTL